MKNEMGTYISGAGREEPRAELSENEQLFFQLTDFLCETVEPIIKKMGVSDVEEVSFKNSLKKDLIKNLRDYIKEAKTHDGDATVYDALKQMNYEKWELVRDIAEPIIAAQKIKEKIESAKETFANMNLQNLFSGLGAVSGVADAVGGKSAHEEVIN